MATHEITLDVTKKEITPQVIHTRVGDSNTTIKATVTNDGAAYSLSGATVKFKAAKPDGTYAEQSATVSGSTATVTLAPEFLAVPGIIKTAYFEITASGKKDTTGNVWIDNRADAEGEAPDLSTSYIPTVDQLVEDATEALNSANTALGNAEEALEDAEAATDSATDAAASANAAASAAQSAIDAMTGNVLRGTVGPSEVVSADDAYAQTPLGLTVYGNTRQNLWVNPVINGTYQGLTATEQDDGSLSINGTAKADTYIVTNHVYALKPSTTYTVSVDKSIATWGFYVETKGGSGKISYYFGGNYNYTGLERTFTTSADLEYVVFAIAIESGATISGTYRVMLNEGSEAQPWCPPGLNSVEGLEIVATGKNMWQNPSTETENGVTFTANDDGSFTLSGSSSSSGGVLFTKSFEAPPEGAELTLSVDKALSENYARVILQFIGNDNAAIGGNHYVGYGGVMEKTVEVPPFTAKIKVGAYFISSTPAGTEVSGTYKPQLEFGGAATDWEPPVHGSATVNLNSNALRSLPDGTCDVLTIGEDGTAGIEANVARLDGSDVSSVGTTSASDVGSIYRGDGRVVSSARQDALACDKMKVVDDNNAYMPEYSAKYAPNSTSNPTAGVVYAKAANGSSLDGVKEWLNENDPQFLYPLKETTAVTLPAVTLPALPGPIANVWAVATDGHGNTFTLQPEIELEYARDVTLVVGSLEAKVAALELLHETE